MHGVLIVAIVFGGIIISLGIIGGTLLMALKLRHSGVSRKGRESQTEEAMMVQEIYHGLSNLEKRLESLETILMDKKEEEH